VIDIHKRGQEMEGNSNAGFTVNSSTKPAWLSWKGTNAGRRIRWIEANCIVPRGAGAGQLVTLLPFQKSFIESVYADGILSAGLSVPRGNGKSALLAMLCLAELYLNEWSPDIVIGGTTLQQSMRPSGVYGLAGRMIRLNPELSERTLIYRSTGDPRFVTPYNDGILAPISTRDPDSLLGLSSSLLVADEFGSIHWDQERWSNLVQSGGKRGGDSRAIGLSTPNDKDSAMYAMRQRVMAGTASPSVAWIEHAAEADADIDDRGQWHRANPALGHFLHISALEADLVDRPAWMFSMMRLGLWQDVADDGWLGPNGPEAWDSTATAVTLDAVEPVHVGVDKSMRDDASAVACMQRIGDRWQTSVKIWMPVDGVIDHAAIRDHIRELCRTLNVVTIAYDPRFMVESAQDLARDGLPMIEVPQTHQRMMPAFSTLHHLIVARQLDHDDDPVLRNHVLRAVPQMAPSGGFTLSKNKSRVKIDGVVAMAIALAGSGDVEQETEMTDEMMVVL
jgi:phage terminase large subunit-like protein